METMSFSFPQTFIIGVGVLTDLELMGAKYGKKRHNCHLPGYQAGRDS